MVFCFGTQDIDAYWHLISHHLERFERETRLITAADLRQQLKDAKKQLWSIYDGQEIAGVAITEIYSTARGSVCCLWGACGTESAPGQIERIMDEVRPWAKSLNCVVFEIRGRPGWERRLKGFKRTAVVLEQEIL